MLARDILLIAPSVSELQRLFRASEHELSCLDVCINVKKSCNVRNGPKSDVKCASISTIKGYNLSGVNEVWYLGTYVITGRQFKWSVASAKRSFHRPTILMPSLVKFGR